MNNPPKKQHYLPAVYLKQFSIEGSDATRKSKLYRLDRNFSGSVTVEDQCREDFYNSAASPVAAEALHQKYEDIYGKLATRIWAGENAGSEYNYFGLIITMLNLHFRNPAYENRTGDERISVYTNLEAEFLEQSLGVRPDPVSPSLEHLALFKKCWGVSLMKTVEPSLLTSDNPAHIFGEDNVPRLITLPITPQVCAVAFDRRKFPKVWSQDLSALDVGRLNSLQAHCCISAVFAAEEISPEDAVKIRDIWVKRREAPPGFIDALEWRPNYRGLEPFEFLK